MTVSLDLKRCGRPATRIFKATGMPEAPLCSLHSNVKEVIHLAALKGVRLTDIPKEAGATCSAEVPRGNA